jgi:hypothetical protein
MMYWYSSTNHWLVFITSLSVPTPYEIAAGSMHASSNALPCHGMIAKCPRHFTPLTRVHSRTNIYRVLLSVLDGGYSDMALTSGAMAHLCVLANAGEGKVDEQWWNVENLEKVVLIQCCSSPVS